MPLSLPSGIFHLIQIKKVRKQDFQREAQNFRLLTGTHEGGPWGWDGAREERLARGQCLSGSFRLLVREGGCEPQTSVPGTGIQRVSAPEISQLRC